MPDLRTQFAVVYLWMYFHTNVAACQMKDARQVSPPRTFAIVAPDECCRKPVRAAPLELQQRPQHLLDAADADRL
jgi:hypothetical protein